MLLAATSVMAATPTTIVAPKKGNQPNKPDLRVETAYSANDIEWHQFGPGMSGNNKKAFWHPTDPNYLYIAPNMGNSYVSCDKGQSYEASADCDAPGYKGKGRGPAAMTSIDFSYQDADYGFATDRSTKGIYRTEDRGHSWILCEEPQFMGRYLSWVESDPTDDNYWYVGGGVLSDKVIFTYPKSHPHGKLNGSPKIWEKSRGLIWRSDDRGKSWKLINKGLPNVADIGQIIVDPSNSKVIYAGTNYGLYKSVNRGDSWSRVENGLEGDVIRWLTSHYDKKRKKLTLFALCNVEWVGKGREITTGTGGLFRSNDGGASWTKINGEGNGSLSLNLAALKAQKSVGMVRTKVYQAAAEYFGESSSALQKKYPDMPTALMQRMSAVEVDPTDVNNLYLVNDYSKTSIVNLEPGALWRSKDGGKSWYIAYRDGYQWAKENEDHIYWKSRAIQPVGNNAFFKYRRNEMATFPYSRKSCNFIKLNADGTAAHVQLGAIALMSSDKGDNWIDIDDRYIFDKTTDKETMTSDSYVGAGNSNLPGHGFYQHPKLPGEVYCCSGENNLWVTCEGADEVRKGGLGVTSIQLIKGTSLSTSSFAIDPIDTDLRYALLFRQHNKGTLARSTDGGKTWATYGQAIPDWELNKSAGGDQSTHQIGLMIDPEQPNYLYFCVPAKANELEYVGPSMGSFGVHRSSDGGATWSAINNNLPASLTGNSPNKESAPSISAIAFDPKKSSTIYAAVQFKNGGLFRSDDRGDSWKAVKSVLPLMQFNGEASQSGVNDIHFDVKGNAYIAVGSRRTDKRDMNAGLWVSRDGMKSWTKLFDHPHTARVETAIYDPNIILVTGLGNSAIEEYNSGIFLSRDGGATWFKINRGNAQSDRVNDIAIDYTRKGRYYVSTFGSGWYYADDPQVK